MKAEPELHLLARTLELTDVEASSGTLSGDHAGIRVSLRRLGRVVHATAEAPEGLRLLRQGQSARGDRDLTVGLPKLDEALAIQGDNPAAVIRILRSEGVAAALLRLHSVALDLSLEAGQLRAALTEQEVQAGLRALLDVAHLLEQSDEAEAARAQSLRRTVQPPVRPLRDLSHEVDAPPPVQPLHRARWAQILGKDRYLAVVLGVPLVALSVTLALADAPKWTFVFPAALIAVMTGLQAWLFRCPGCGARLERHGVQNAGAPLICKQCGTRVA